MSAVGGKAFRSVIKDSKFTTRPPQEISTTKPTSRTNVRLRAFQNRAKGGQDGYAGEVTDNHSSQGFAFQQQRQDSNQPAEVASQSMRRNDSFFNTRDIGHPRTPAHRERNIYIASSFEIPGFGIESNFTCAHIKSNATIIV